MSRSRPVSTAPRDLEPYRSWAASVRVAWLLFACCFLLLRALGLMAWTVIPVGCLVAVSVWLTLISLVLCLVALRAFRGLWRCQGPRRACSSTTGHCVAALVGLAACGLTLVVTVQVVIPPIHD